MKRTHTTREQAAIQSGLTRIHANYCLTKRASIMFGGRVSGRFHGSCGGRHARGEDFRVSGERLLPLVASMAIGGCLDETKNIFIKKMLGCEMDLAQLTQCVQEWTGE